MAGQADFIDIQRVTPTTGQTVVVANADGHIIFIVDAAGTIASLTVTVPSNPWNGQKVTLATRFAITTCTLQGATINGASFSPAANAAGTWIWISTQLKWYKIG